MRTEAMTWVVSWSLMLALGLLATLALVGCAGDGGRPSTPPLATPAPLPEQRDPAGGPHSAETEAEAQSRAIAERLAAGLKGSDGMGPDFDPFADALPLPDQRPAPESDASSVATDPAVTPDPAAAEPPVAVMVEPPPAEPAPPPAPAMLGRDELLSALAEQIQAGEDPALVKAVTAAALSLANPGGSIDPRLLDPLKPMQREAVQRVHQLFLAVRRQAASDPAAADSAAAAAARGLDRKSLVSAVADAFAGVPITITHADLCRSVHSYGAYEPLDAHTFLSGRANRAIVYVEVDNFAAAPLDDGKREVKLTQELILYKEADGLAVWKHQPTDILDVSRNYRRDFYTVQMITLPAQLGEGKYRLKIRITDQHGDAVDETTLSLEVVADAALLGS